jgi:hypothetical protein
MSSGSEGARREEKERKRESERRERDKRSTVESSMWAVRLASGTGPFIYVNLEHV